MKKIDEIMTWKGFGNGFGNWDSKCRIRIFEKKDYDVVIATELHDNAGTDIKNCIENVAMMAISKYDLEMKRFIFIEHYPEIRSMPLGFHQKQSFSSLDFQMQVKKNILDPTGKTQTAMLTSPTWKPLKKAHVESLIEEAWND